MCSYIDDDHYVPEQLKNCSRSVFDHCGPGPVGVTTAVTGPVAINPTNPFLLLDVVRVRDFSLNTRGEFTKSNTESFYVQDDFRPLKNLQINIGLRWDYQQAYTLGVTSTLT